jgi:DNA mismatch repair protein MutS
MRQGSKAYESVPNSPPYQVPEATAGKPGAMTPMMAQYLKIKERHQDCLLFYRMGDFFEMFFDDARQAAAALDIALTKRGQHLGADIPMCGVPAHSADPYIARLIRAGFKVAICEQMEDPAAAKKRGSKAVVKREVVRLVTAGTLTEEGLLEARAHNYLAAVSEAAGVMALAWLDISTGDFATETLAGAERLPSVLARLAPGEILLPERLVQRAEQWELLGQWKERLSPLPSARFDSDNARRRLQEMFGVKTLEAFGDFSRAELSAAGTLIDYVELTQKGRLPRLSPPQRVVSGSVMEIDPATRRNLELVESLSGGRRGTLVSVVDRCVTGAGARLLASRLAAPLTDIAAIARRLDAVDYFLCEEALRDDLRGGLKSCPDVARALARLTVGRGGPRDLAALRDGLAAARVMRGQLAAAGLRPPPKNLTAIARDLGHHDVLVDRLERALAAELPLAARDGGFIAPGYAPELDELKTLRDESRRLVAALQGRYVEATGIGSLKIKHNNVLGYFVDVTPTHADKMSGDTQFIHRQTLAGAVRFTTVELRELEQKIASAAEKVLAIELQLFQDLVSEVAGQADGIALTAQALARLDVATALAALAGEAGWCRPVVEESLAFEIEQGRHPVVAAALAVSQDGGFVANDCALGTDGGDDGAIWLVTGPNMAGKSTFLRQNALIAVLAQAGAFVPAVSARIGIVDRLFSRVGAADDLARGRSTFMVEMVETAAILNQAGPRSLVILDEIGRGTATFDGLSIAWATIEHLHEVNRCRALFATHYHELTGLAAKLARLTCHTMRVKEWQGEVVFLHEVTAGTADRSYGIHVAKLAGLPSTALRRAEEVLAILERGEQAGDLARLAEDLPLFAARPARVEPQGPSTSPLEARLAEVLPDELSPREALELIYQLKALARASED